MKDKIIGQTLGKYRIEGVLGSGGMGQVYKGTHLYLDRPAAIKVMQANMAINSTFRTRFLLEAKTAAALRHPNVVEIYDYGDQDGQLYLVMELMTDGSLRTLLKQNAGQSWPLALALDMMRQAALGLAAAHAMNMVHRDIKPDNMLLNKTSGAQPNSQPYILKISDFGLARLVEGAGLTMATAAPMGTLAYMSPEQCQNKKVDGRSDIYSLGIVLYEVTTGLRPFKIDSFVEALNKHSSAAPPPPRQQRPDLPPLVEEITLRCLAKRPEDRYATAHDLARDLQRALSEVGGKIITPSAQASPVPSTPLILQAPTSGTYVQPPEMGGALPPKVSTLPGTGSAPRVRILDQNETTVQNVEVRMQGLTLGRQVGNDIVLNEHGVSRQHLQILWDGQQVLLKDLGSSNGTYLEGTRLMPQVSQVWQNRQMVRVGPFWLRLEGMDDMASMTARAAPPTALYANRTNAQTMGAPTVMNSGRIGLSINTKTLSIPPGQPTGVRVTLTNLGNTVDWFTTTIEGVPPEWVQGAGKEVQLNPGMQEAVDLTVNVPRAPQNRAQDYPVVIRARSREMRNETNTVQAQWTVQPFHEGTLRLEPRRVIGRGSAIFNLAMQNSGNVVERYEMSGEDDEQKLSYGFGQNPVDLEPGREARIGVHIGTSRHWIGREQRYPFQIHLRTPSTSNPATATGEFVNKAILPAWLLPVIGAVVAIGLVISSLTGVLPFPPKGLAATPTTPILDGGKTKLPIASPSTSTAISPTAGGSPSVTPSLSPSPTVTFASSNVTNVTSGTTIGGAIGSQYVASQDKLYFVEYSGNLSVLNNVSTGSPTYQVLGTGYTNPEDVVISSDTSTAYITERGGDLVRVSLSSPDRANATLVVTGLTAPHQIVLDEANNIAYVAQYTNPGLVRIDLSSGSPTPTSVLSTLQNAIGLQMSADFSTAYITEQLSNGKGQLERFNLSDGNETVLATSSQAPLFMLSWTSPSKTALLVTERDTANKVWYVDVTHFPTALKLVANVSTRPSSVVTVASNTSTSLLPMLVCANNEIDRLT